MFQPPQERPLAINAFPRRMQPREIIERVLVWHPGVTHADIIGPCKERTRIIPARFDVIAALYTVCRIEGRPPSMPWIGRLVGGRDHSTIASALKRRGLK